MREWTGSISDPVRRKALWSLGYLGWGQQAKEKLGLCRVRGKGATFPSKPDAFSSALARTL